MTQPQELQGRTRVLVVHPPLSVAHDFIDYPYFSNLGPLSVVAQLEATFEVTYVDAFALAGSSLFDTPEGRLHMGASLDELGQALPPSADAVVVNYTPFHRPPGRCPLLGDLLRALTQRYARAPIYLADCYQSGQHYVEVSGEEVLASYPEACAWIKYEGEVSVSEAISRGATGTIRGTRPKLADLRPPAFDRINLEHFDAFRSRVVAGLNRTDFAFPIDGRTLPLVTSRGCPFKCVHCSSNPDRDPSEPKTQRRLSGEQLVAQVARLKALGATRLFVMDELVNVNRTHFDTLLEEVARLDLLLEVPNGFRADYLEPRHFALLRGRATTVSVSAESANARVLDEVVGKDLDLSCIERAAENAQRAAVPLMVHYMIGLPTETPEEINDTLEYALDLWDRFGAYPAVQFATPLPGTRLARQNKSESALPVLHDWGPHFQKVPSTGELPREILSQFRRTFDARLDASTGPKKLIINVTYVCNNHCTFCAVGTRTQVDGHPTRQKQHLDRYRRQGVRQVDFDGGEPTLNPELLGLVSHARRIGYERVNVTTNGRMCAYPDYAKKLMHSGVTTTLFSVHGPNAKIHAQQVGVAEAFEQTVQGIRNCVDAAPEGVDLGMNVTVTKGNAEHLRVLTELALSLGLPWINIQFLTPFGRATEWVAPDTQAAANTTMRIIDEFKDRMKIQVINLPFCFMPGYEEYLAGDLNKLSRHMVFVNNETVNLAEYLAERRVHKPQCAPCPHRSFCGGFYELKNVPEPEWLVTAESLVRPVSPDRTG